MVNTGDLPPNGLLTTRAGRSIYVPLVSVHAQVYIADICARVILNQRFDAKAVSSGGSLPAAKYIFPVPSSVAVCAFEVKAAGRKVVGEVKQVKAAKKAYDISVAQGELAGLLVEASADVFVLSIGAIPVKQSVTVKITYVTELLDDALFGTLRFAFPTYYGQRYGANPAIVSKSTSSANDLAQFTLSADLEMTSPIEAISCLSHNTSTFTERDSPKAKVVLNASANARLDRDFVLSIRASGVNTPRCIAECLQDKPSVALSLTLVPRFGVAPLSEQEYIFLVDRSGSMKNMNRIDFAKKAMLILLQSLPSNGTYFNIVSFGSKVSALWPSSRLYTPDTLNAAENHVDSMQPDFGGTKIEAALKSIYQSRRTRLPTSILILTDGDVWNASQVISSSRAAVAAATKANSETYLRIFTLGIGDGASTEMCEGLARVGNGICYMTTQSDEIAPKCKALLDASSAPPSGNLTNLRIDWGYVAQAPRAERSIAATSFFDPDFDVSAPSRSTGARVLVQQAPSRVPPLYVNDRFIVSAILSGTDTPPTSVTLVGDTPDGQVVRLPVSVRSVPIQPKVPPMIHTLAARRLIREIGDGDYESLGVMDKPGPSAFATRAETAIVRLSEEYQLMSEFTAFVAVEQRSQADDSDSDQASSNFDGASGDKDIYDEEDDEYWDSLRPDKDNNNYNDEDDEYWDNVRPGKDDENSEDEDDDYWRSARQSMTPSRKAGSLANRMFALRAWETLGAVPAARGPAPRAARFAAPQREASIASNITLVPRIPLLRLRSDQHSGVPFDDPIAVLAKLQEFDGSFKLDDRLISILFNNSISAAQLKRSAPSAITSDANWETIWATTVAAAYMRVVMEDNANLWSVLWAKAMAFVVQRIVGGPSTFEQLVVDATKLFRG